MNGLEKPQFIDTDAQSILDACIAEYERLTGRPLYPAQSERLLINRIAYREHLVRVGIQEAAEQNLVAFARAPMLDYLGELVGVTRIPAQPARCILRFSLDAPAVSPVFIPAGTGVYSNDGKHLFTTEADGTIESGVVAIDVSAVADEAGEDANGLKPGNVSPLAGDVTDEPLSVRNVDVTSGGSDESWEIASNLSAYLIGLEYGLTGRVDRPRGRHIADVSFVEWMMGLPEGWTAPAA